MKKERCENCKFWQYEHARVFNDGRQDEPIGTCRIRSPDDAEWPERFDTDWCGEYTSKTSRKRKK